LLTTAAVLPLVAEARSQSAQVSWLRPPDSGVVGELATFVAALAGKTATVLGDPDQPHTYTYIPDIGEGLAVLGEHRMRRLLSQTRLDQSRRAAAIAGAMNALSERRK
jgi:hypothetical protein